jgi:hypothetical protein
MEKRFFSVNNKSTIMTQIDLKILYIHLKILISLVVRVPGTSILNFITSRSAVLKKKTLIDIGL